MTPPTWARWRTAENRAAGSGQRQRRVIGHGDLVDVRRILPHARRPLHRITWREVVRGRVFVSSAAIFGRAGGTNGGGAGAAGAAAGATAGAFGFAGGSPDAGGADGFAGVTGGADWLKPTAALARRAGHRADSASPSRGVVGVVVVHDRHRDLRGSAGRCAEGERAALVVHVLARRVSLRTRRRGVTQRRVRVRGGRQSLPLPGVLGRGLLALAEDVLRELRLGLRLRAGLTAERLLHLGGRDRLASRNAERLMQAALLEQMGFLPGDLIVCLPVAFLAATSRLLVLVARVGIGRVRHGSTCAATSVAPTASGMSASCCSSDSPGAPEIAMRARESMSMFSSA